MLAAGPPAIAQIPCKYDVLATLQAPASPGNYSPTYPSAISPNGQHVVGYYNFNVFGDDKPWYWSQATGFVSLPLPPGFYAAAPNDINDSRVIVGTGLVPTYGSRGYMYDMATGVFTIFDPLPGGAWSGANAINNAGTVCGFRSIGPGTIPQSAFVWSPADGGTFTDLGVMNGPNSSALAISGTGVVVGFTGLNSASSNSAAFVHQNGTTQILEPVPGGISSVGRAANSAGRVLLTGQVGTQTNYVVRTFVLNGADSTELLPLAGDTFTVAADISESNVVVGVSRTVPAMGGPIDRPAIWNGPTAINISDRVTLPLGTTLGGPLDLSDDGRIVLIGKLSGHDVTVVIAPSPPVVGDTNCDGRVNVFDLLQVVTSWGACVGCAADMNSDSFVNVSDLLIVIMHWSP